MIDGQYLRTLTFLYLLVAKSLANMERYLLYTYPVETIVVMVTAVVGGYIPQVVCH